MNLGNIGMGLKADLLIYRTKLIHYRVLNTPDSPNSVWFLNTQLSR